MKEDIIQEITPLEKHDFMYVADRRKAEFDYPMHWHDLFELNYVENAEGCERIVGDSVETIGNYDLVLVTSPSLVHSWMQNDDKKRDIHEITIQFALDYENSPFFDSNPMRSIKQMFIRAQRGLAFPMPAIMTVYDRLVHLSEIKEGFLALVELFHILYALSKFDDARELSTSTFANATHRSDDGRIVTVKDYILDHYREEIRLEQLSRMVSMSPTAFSRFFKQRTGKTLAEYIVNVRLGHAARQLIDTKEPVSQICYDCGFNTLSNFNRLFRLRRGCSPTEFRDKYAKTKVIV
ncbi:MAG: helix-turn-helix domain-containing protein [Paludibacteraceae bacterium]|nr:helix-turn-helix domain-containing protein [Paludibacteraceae bacterium]